MPKFPVIQTQVADPARAAQYGAPDVVPVQPQEPQQLQRLGQAMEQSGQQFSALAADRQRRIDLAAHTEREAAAKEIEIAKFSEFGKLQGKAAVDGFDGYMKEMEKRHEAAIRSAPTGPQRDWLQAELRNVRLKLLGEATNHRDRELRTWRVGGASASLQQSIKTAIAMHGSPDDDSNAQDVADKARELAALQGASDEQTNMLVAQGISDMHVGRVGKLLADKRTAEAATYLASHKNEISQESYEREEKVTKAAVIEDVARNAYQSAGTFEERVRAVDELPGLSDTDRDSARRHLQQLQANEDRENARIAVDVQREADAWNAANPFLDMQIENPGLYARVAKYDVNPERKRVNNQQFIDATRTPEGMRKLRAMAPEQLEATLNRYTTSSTAESIKALVVGDQSTLSILQNTKDLATAIGIDTKDDEVFNSWRRNTIDPLVDAERTKLGRPLTPTEFQEKVVSPLMQDKVLIEGMFGYTEMPVIQAQQQGYMPIDKPETLGVDESLDVKNATVAVRVGGETVRLSQIPMQERRKIREAYRQEWIAQRGSSSTMPQMTAIEEATRWVRDGRVGDKAKRVANNMRIPGVGWGVGDLNQEDLPPLPDRSGEPDEYLIPGIKQAELPK